MGGKRNNGKARVVREEMRERGEGKEEEREGGREKAKGKDPLSVPLFIY